MTPSPARGEGEIAVRHSVSKGASYSSSPWAISDFRRRALPSLFRFLLIVGILAALVYGGMLALVAYVPVQQREITQTVPLNKPAK